MLIKNRGHAENIAIWFMTRHNNFIVVTLNSAYKTRNAYIGIFCF